MNLVFHQAALGDFALILPLLRGLDGPTTVVAPWSHGRLAAALAPGVGVMDIEMFEFTRLWADGGPSILSPAVRELFERAERVISFVAGADSAWAANVTRLAGDAEVVCAAPRPPASWTRHVTAWQAAQLKQQGIELGRGDTDSRLAGKSGWVLHPGSGGEPKCWPLDHFVQVATALSGSGKTVRFLIGDAEVERGLADQLRNASVSTEIIHSRDTESLLQALRGAACYLGNDAGPTHVAAQCGLRTVALFGPTDPRVWAPVGPNVTVLSPPQPAPMSWLGVDAVIEATS